MSRLIDADALIETFEPQHDCDWYTPDIIENINEQPTVDAVPLSKIYRLIEGHSNYHGDSILAALTCVAEGKNVKPIKPVDAVPVVRCKECKHSDLPSVMTMKYGKPGTLTCCNRYSPCNHRNVNKNDFCSYGEGEKND